MPTQAAHKEAIIRPIQAVAAELQADLGQKLVAYAIGTSPKAVGRWAAGGNEPRGATERRLRELYRAVLILKQCYRPETIRAWLLGANPDLNDRAPIEALREGDAVEVFHAADAFLEA